MTEWIQQNEAVIRLSFFLGIFALMALWEMFAPCRDLLVSKGRRWLNNLGLVVLNTVVLRLVFPTAAVGMAAFAQANGWGLFNYLQWPHWLSVLLAVALLDMAIYLQHVMVHAVPALWRLHRVHHADRDFDVTTALRFHPVEILFSMVIKFAVIAALGPAVVAVVIFEVLLNGTAMFNHGNVRLPAGLERIVRLLVVTPDMHRVHHSVEDDETNSNFGFNLSIWDRLFGTYRDQPRAGHQAMTIGVRGMDDNRVVVDLPGLLTMPMKRDDGGYVINRRHWD